MTDLLLLAAAGLVPVALALGALAAARRRRVVLRRTGTARLRLRLRGAAAPYPARGAPGRLTVGPGVLTWAGRGGPVLDLQPCGLRVLGPRTRERADGGTEESAVLAAVDGLGTPVRLVGGWRALEDVERLLRERPLPEEPAAAQVVRAAGRPRLLLPALLALAGLAGLALAGSVLLTAVRVTGTTVGEADADDYCAVRWTDPRDGRTETRSLDCYWDVGDDVALLLPGAPLHGTVLDADDPELWAGASGALLLGGVGLGALRLRQRSADRRQPTAPSHPARPSEVVERVAAGSLERADVERVLRARAGAEGWAFDRDPGLPPESEPSRATAVATALATALGGLLPLAGGVLLSLLFGWTAVAGLWAGAGPTVEVDARSSGFVAGVVPLLVDDAEVSFDLAGGGRETTLVAVRPGADLQEGDVVRLRYDPDDPDRVRAVQDDAALLGALAAALVLLVGSGWSAALVLREVRGRRALARARRGPVRTVPYLLAPDWDGSCVLLLYDAPHGPPRHALDLAGDQLGRLPAAGTVEVRGRYDAGEVVVAHVQGREVPLTGPLLALDGEDAASVVNAEPPGEDD